MTVLVSLIYVFRVVELYTHNSLDLPRTVEKFYNGRERVDLKSISFTGHLFPSRDLKSVHSTETQYK